MATTVKTVRKRDGEIKEFKPSKIIEAVRKAARSAKIELDEATYLKLIRYVTSRVSKLPEPIEIDQIHDAVEDALMKYNLFSVERSYHDKRVKRDEERFKQYAVIKEMDEKLSAKKPVQQNANLDEFSFGGKKGEMDSAYLKDKALKYYISDEHAKNHINNRIYIHDLDSYVVGMHNCVARDTEIITSDGIKRFYNFKDGDKIDVLASDGFFREATVKFYGKKQMQDVVLSRCGSSKKVRCTPDHRWILQDGTVTTSLQVGDKLIPLAKTEDCEDALWKVESIKKCRGEFEAWCVEEPETHSFTLAGGIVTGNCLSTPMDELLANGLKTRQTNIRPAGSVSTAFQLVAVIFQLQSLQQFGGVAATHLDWTLVPYVRKSFAKHFRDGMKYIEGIEIDSPNVDNIDEILSKVESATKQTSAEDGSEKK
jgi:anaerobic ribonucleoside-triphosphate reductase